MKTSRFCGALLCAAALSGAARAQTPDSGAFVVRLGSDTIAVERYVSTPTELRSEALLRTPQTRMLKLTVTRNADGSLAAYEVLNEPVKGVPNSSPPTRTFALYQGDSVRIEFWSGGNARPPRTIAGGGDMWPLQIPFYSTYEAALRQSRALHADSTNTVMLTGAGPLPYTVRWFGADSVTMFTPLSGLVSANVDANGRLMHYNGEGTTFKVQVTRVPWFDIAPFAERFAAVDAAGRSIGALSPRDSVQNHLLKLSYGRPSARGRVIFGNVVPWGEVWRTGANAATSIEFYSDVVINGTPVPAGSYTLWTIPDAKQWLLVINKQTGQWGTNYDAKQDLARIPVKTESVPVPVETFTAELQSRGTGSVLVLTWARTRIVIPIEAANN